MINRVQQYDVSARLALGQTSLGGTSENKKLGRVPLQTPSAGSGKLSLNLGKLQDNVNQFAESARAHLELTSKYKGSVARLEIAVPCDVDDADDAFLHSIHDAILMVQHNTVVYDQAPWIELIKFYVEGLISRVHCIQKAVTESSNNFDEDVKLRDDIMVIVTDIASCISSFYNGIGTLGTKQRPLTKSGYMNNRPVFCPMGEYTNKKRISLLSCEDLYSGKNVDVLENFFVHLFHDCKKFLPVPDQHLFMRKNPLYGFVGGRACPACFAVYNPTEPNFVEKYAGHACEAYFSTLGSLPREAPTPGSLIPLTHPSFLKNHEKKCRMLTPQQYELMSLMGLCESNSVRTDANIMVNGGAGTGKSFAIGVAVEKCYMISGMQSVLKLAPTNIAANNIDAVTIHSFFGMGANDIGKFRGQEESIIKKLKDGDKMKIERLKNQVKYIFVDEVGMIQAKALRVLDRLLRMVMDLDKTFGGYRIILVGDPLQVAPANLDGGEGYFFHSSSFMKANLSFYLYLRIHIVQLYWNLKYFNCMLALGSYTCVIRICHI